MARMKTQVRREQLVLSEILRLAPELEEHSMQWLWDCRLPGGCSLKRPDLFFEFPDRYLQVEIDEHGRERLACWDEDSRLEVIAADVGKPGFVLRINPDREPLMRR